MSKTTTLGGGSGVQPMVLKQSRLSKALRLRREEDDKTEE